MRAIILAALACCCANAQTVDAPSFEVASVKHAAPKTRPIMCSGGPGSSSPGIWTCTCVPLAFLISQAYHLQLWQFPPGVQTCCQARFDITAKVPPGTTRPQFLLMMQKLLVDRFHLALHHEQKEMKVFELTVGVGGSKLKPTTHPDYEPPQDPWELPRYTVGKDGYPEYEEGRTRLAGMGDYYRWVGFKLTTAEIAKTMEDQLGGPVQDATGLKGTYDVDLKWTIDSAWILELAGHADMVPDLPAGSRGPNLLRALQDQLGLKVTSKKGPGDIVVVNHVNADPVEN